MDVGGTRPESVEPAVDATVSWDALASQVRAARDDGERFRALAAALAGVHRLRAMVELLLTELPSVLRVDFVNVAVLDDDGVVRLMHPDGLADDIAARWNTVELSRPTPLTDAIRSGEDVVVHDRAALVERYPDMGRDSAATGLECLAAHAVRDAAGSVVAAFGLGTARPGGIELHHLLPVLALCGSALQRAITAERAARVTALLDTFIRRAPIGLAFLDRRLRFAMINDRLAEVNGLPAAAHLGRTLADVVPDLASQAVPMLEEVLRTGKPIVGLRITGVTPGTSGAVRSWDESFYPVETAAGEIIGVGTIVEDVTERLAKERELADVHAQQRRLAERLQNGLLPALLPDIAGYDTSVRYAPGTEGLSVGGDWYDIIPVGANDVALVVGDVVGHDLDAAIAMAQLRNATIALSFAHTDPDAVLSDLDHFVTLNPMVLGSTIFYGRLDPTTGVLRYVLAGHHRPLLAAAGHAPVFHEGPRGTPLGVASTRPVGQLVLEPGSLLLAYTDGLVEHRSEAIDEGLDRLLQAVGDATPASDLGELSDRLVADVPHTDRRDDLVLLAVRRHTIDGA